LPAVACEDTDRHKTSTVRRIVLALALALARSRSRLALSFTLSLTLSFSLHEVHILSDCHTTEQNAKRSDNQRKVVQYRCFSTSRTPPSLATNAEQLLLPAWASLSCYFRSRFCQKFCSFSPTKNPPKKKPLQKNTYGGHVTSLLLVCSLSSHRHSCILFIFGSRFIDS